MWCICLHSPIISTYNQSFENELTIVIRHYYSSLRFISVSISHICNFIYCYGFDFDRIRFIKFQCSIRFLFYFIININKISIPCMLYLPFTIIWLRIVFYFIILEDKSFFQQGQWRLFAVNTIEDWFFMNLLITLSPMSATCCWDCSQHWTFTPQPLFSPFCGWHSAFLGVVRYSSAVPVGGAISAKVAQKSGAPFRETTCKDPCHNIRSPLSSPLSVTPDGSFQGWWKVSLSIEERVAAGGIYKPPWCDNLIQIMRYK